MLSVKEIGENKMSGNYPDVEKCLMKRIPQCWATNVLPGENILREKTDEFWKQLGLMDGESWQAVDGLWTLRKGITLLFTKILVKVAGVTFRCNMLSHRLSHVKPCNMLSRCNMLSHSLQTSLEKFVMNGLTCCPQF